MDNPITDAEKEALNDVVIRRGLPAVLTYLALGQRADVDAHTDREDHPRVALHHTAALALESLAAMVAALVDEADPDWGPGPNLAFFVDPDNTGGGTH